MAVEVLQNEEISEREKESVLLSIEAERIGKAYILRKVAEKELFSEMLTPT